MIWSQLGSWISEQNMFQTSKQWNTSISSIKSSSSWWNCHSKSIPVREIHQLPWKIAMIPGRHSKFHPPKQQHVSTSASVEQHVTTELKIIEVLLQESHPSHPTMWNTPSGEDASKFLWLHRTFHWMWLVCMVSCWLAGSSSQHAKYIQVDTVDGCEILPHLGWNARI